MVLQPGLKAVTIDRTWSEELAVPPESSPPDAKFGPYKLVVSTKTVKALDCLVRRPLLLERSQHRLDIAHFNLQSGANIQDKSARVLATADCLDRMHEGSVGYRKAPRVPCPL